MNAKDNPCSIPPSKEAVCRGGGFSAYNGQHHGVFRTRLAREGTRAFATQMVTGTTTNGELTEEGKSL